MKFNNLNVKELYFNNEPVCRVLYNGTTVADFYRRPVRPTVTADMYHNGDWWVLEVRVINNNTEVKGDLQATISIYASMGSIMDSDFIRVPFGKSGAILFRWNSPTREYKVRWSAHAPKTHICDNVVTYMGSVQSPGYYEESTTTTT